MPGSLPTARPIFLDEELRNGNFATPTLLRKMIDWCRFSYARDLPFLPNDPRCGFIHDELFSTITGDPWRGQVGVGQTWWRPFGSFYVPDPLGPARRLNVQVYVGQAQFIPGFTEVVSPTYPVEILLTSNRGLSAVLTVTATGWADFTIPAAPDSIVTIQARSSNPTDIEKQCGTFLGICAQWEEPSALVPGMSVDTTGIPLPSQDFPAQNRSASVALTRSMARWMNRFTARTCRQVVAKWFEAPVEVTAVARTGRLLSEYRVWISDGADTLEFRWAQVGVAPGDEIVVTVPGEGSVTTYGLGGTSTLAVTPGAGRLATIQVAYNCTGAGTVALLYFTAVEKKIGAASIPLPAGESIPLAMQALARDSIRAESSIVATGQTGLLDVLKAMLYVVSTRERALVKDAGLTLDRTTGATAGGGTGTQVSMYLGVTQPTQVIVRAGVHGRSTGSALPALAYLYSHNLVPGNNMLARFTVSAPKANVDSLEVALANLADQPGIGTKVQQWPEWITWSPATPSPDGMSLLDFGVEKTDGLYEAEWTGASIEKFLAEADVP